MKVLIDDGRCQGHGRCWSTERGLFEPMDDLGHSAVVGGEDQPDDPDVVAQAMRAAEACPERAITVVRD
ncbi:MAG TPA: ferredoxin [Acidimicrobiia bacterium]|jgi:ferredoxin|nr:ferredoxin [Acidimicrobiia bacterium]